MSASLVGSEMCIRDRALPARMCTHTQTRRDQTKSEGSLVGSLLWWHRACLLYTSDAADDM
eukprot:3757695-Alexandrium_andersonii.AAC.1